MSPFFLHPLTAPPSECRASPISIPADSWFSSFCPLGLMLCRFLPSYSILYVVMCTCLLVKSVFCRGTVAIPGSSLNSPTWKCQLLPPPGLTAHHRGLNSKNSSTLIPNEHADSLRQEQGTRNPQSQAKLDSLDLAPIHCFQSFPSLACRSSHPAHFQARFSRPHQTGLDSFQSILPSPGGVKPHHHHLPASPSTHPQKRSFLSLISCRSFTRLFSAVVTFSAALPIAFIFSVSTRSSERLFLQPACCMLQAVQSLAFR